jgi:CheY-like chemotaxis protein
VSERATRRRLEDRDAAELAPSTSREPPSRAELAETLPDSLAAHLSILIVDDDPAMRSVLERAALKAFPDRRLDIVHAGSGAEALPAAARSLPDLILIDYDMPGMNGVDTLARLRGLEGGKHTPAIVVTGHSEETIRWRFELLGISDFLCKPVDFPSIVASLQAVVQSSRSSTQTVSPVLA